MQYLTTHVQNFVDNHPEIGEVVAQEILERAKRFSSPRGRLESGAVEKIFTDPDLRHKFTMETGDKALLKALKRPDRKTA